MVRFVIDETLSDFCYFPFSWAFPERADKVVPVLAFAKEQGIVCSVEILSESIGIKRCGMRRTEFVAREEYRHRLVIEVADDVQAILLRLRFPSLQMA